MTTESRIISIIGDGSWGTALAVLLANNGYNPIVWGAFSDYVKVLTEKRENVKFLPGIKLPDSISFTDSLEQAISSEIIVLAVPSQYIRAVALQLKKYSLDNKIFVNVSKGIETSSLETVSDIIGATLGDVRYVTLTGPAIATEVAQNIPTAAIVASKDNEAALRIQEIFSTPSFRVYTIGDVYGAELGASFKNVIAIAAGACDGLGFGINTKSALITRGLSEMARLGEALGGKRETFYGLSGLGDLVTTCMSPKSRNRSFGEAIGKGENVQEYLKKSVMAVEGVPTAKAALALAEKTMIDAPVIKAVNSLIDGENPSKVFMTLMQRPLKSEL